MIHELIDQKKKVVRSSLKKNTKIFDEYLPKTCCDNGTPLEHSDNENKEVGDASNTFIPPWLRNSLGLSQRHNQNLDWSLCLPNLNSLGNVAADQKSSKTISRQKEQIHNELEDLKPHAEPNCTINVTCDIGSSSRELRTNMKNCRSIDVTPVRCNGGKPVTVFWTNTRKASECDSTYTNSEIKVPKRDDSKLTYTDLSNLPECEKLKEDEKKKSKLLKQRNKLKRRNPNDHCSEYYKNDVDCLLENKAKEVLNNYTKKDVHSVSSDMKHLEAKLILLEAKCRDSDYSKLSQQELRLLQEIQEQAGNKEELDKLMTHVRETNLREWLKGRGEERSSRMTGEKSKRDGKGPGQNSKVAEEGTKTGSDKDSLRSTDDENDIKRFSEFLSKNKNVDEKRKCLEEVRNYFERKRRTRLTKRRCSEEISKCQKHEFYALERKSDSPREKSGTDDQPGGKDEKKKKFIPCNEEVVEKAVSETLQKFMSLYHFHVSPTMMGNMRKNILQAIQSDSFDNNSQRKNIAESNENADEKRKEKMMLDVDLQNNRIIHNDNQRSISLNLSNIVNYERLYSSDCNGEKKSLLKSLDNHSDKKSIEINVLENDNIRDLKKEFDNCLKSVLFHADGTRLKIQSLILEKEDKAGSKGVSRFLYNFSNKSLELINVDMEKLKSGLWERPGEEKKKVREESAQTFSKLEMVNRRNARSQTVSPADKRNQSMQTLDKILMSNSVQTTAEENIVKEIKELKDFDISPGLYRMVKSKDMGRFYLYPEREEESKSQGQSNGTDSSASKFTNCDSHLENSPKNSSEKPISKEIRVMLKEGRKGHKSKKKVSARAFGKKDSASAKLNASVNCLFFRKSLKSSLSYLKSQSKREHDLSNGEITTEIGTDQNSSKDSHFGCFWFWNGQKITPGCDLKAHVEGLIIEKLKEMCNMERGGGIDIGKGPGMLDASSERSAATTVTKSKSVNEIKYPGDCRKVDGTETEKVVKNVGTQNSQHSFLSLNVAKNKSRLRRGNASKTKLGNSQKKNLARKSNRDAKAERISLTAISNLLKTIKEIKKLQLHIEHDKETFPDSSSVLDGTPSSSTSKNDLVNSVSSVLRFKDKDEISKVDVAENATKIFDIGNRESRVTDTFEKESSGEKSSQEPENLNEKHCELLATVLNRVSLEERESLWDDVREFIKKKIGRDIDDDGAREVCIEIEQDVPNSGLGQVKHAVMAKGHYKRNEGDVEVEIDLTLNDLEKILKQRQKRMKRCQVWKSSRIRKPFSSSSAQSGLTRKDMNKYQRHFCNQNVPRNCETEKELKLFRKNKNQ